SMADRIAVMSAGHIVQVGTARELFEQPATAFVAEFIGHFNVLPGEVVESGELSRVRTALGELWVPESALRAHGRELTLAIRPDRLRFVNGSEAGGSRDNRLSGKTLESSFLGESSEHWVKAGEVSLRVTHNPPLFDVPTDVQIAVDPWQITVVKR